MPLSLRTLVEDAVDVMKEVEWSWVLGDDNQLRCPVCYVPKKYGHHRNCRLATALYGLDDFLNTNQ